MTNRRHRVIVNTDAKNEADDQYAIVHALLSPTLDIRGLVAAHFGSERSTRSMQDSREEIDLVLELMGQTGRVTVANGAATALPDEITPLDSPGAQLIIKESENASGRTIGDPSSGEVPAPRVLICAETAPPFVGAR